MGFVTSLAGRKDGYKERIGTNLGEAGEKATQGRWIPPCSESCGWQQDGWAPSSMPPPVVLSSISCDAPPRAMGKGYTAARCPAVAISVRLSGPLRQKTRSSAEGRVSQRYWMLRGRYCGQQWWCRGVWQKWQRCGFPDLYAGWQVKMLLEQLNFFLKTTLLALIS